jgi:DNA polymerase III sliding clamp (beta) subunit (PCNA family)
MKATVDFFDLNAVVQAMDRAADVAGGSSVFEFVRFTVEGGKLKLDAYNGDDGVHVTLEADEVYALEDGCAIVRLCELAPVLRKIKDVAIVRIEEVGGEVWMHFETLSYKFQEQPITASSYFDGKLERVFATRERTVGFSVPAEQLRVDLAGVKSAMGDFECRTLACVCCEMEGDGVRFVASNGRVLVERSRDTNNSKKCPDGVGFIPREFVAMLERLLVNFPGPAHVAFDAEGGGVNIGGVVSLAWEFENSYPHWRNCFPTDKPKCSIEILNIWGIVDALETVDRTWDRVEDEDGDMDEGLADKCVLATDGKGGMVITGDIEVGHRSYCLGALKCSWSIPVNCYGAGAEIIVLHFNPNYLRAALKAFADEESVVMEYRGENTPVKFCGALTSACLMPYRD